MIDLAAIDDLARRLSNLVPLAQAAGLQVHPYTFRRDELPADIANFRELLDIFIGQAGIDGLFTDAPGASRQAMRIAARIASSQPIRATASTKPASSPSPMAAPCTPSRRHSRAAP